MPDESFSDAVSRRSLRVSDCVRLPVYNLDEWVHSLKAKAGATERMRRKYRKVEQAGYKAKLSGATMADCPYQAIGWRNAWRRGWERG